MSKFELQENKVVIFDNDTKGNAKAPIVTGKANIEGTQVKVAGWKAKEGPSTVGKLSTGNKDEGYSVVGGFDYADATKTKERSPDKTGVITLNGKDYKLALWKKVSKNGLSFLSGTLQDPDKAIVVTKTVTPSSNIEEDIF